MAKFELQGGASPIRFEVLVVVPKHKERWNETEINRDVRDGRSAAV